MKKEKIKELLAQLDKIEEKLPAGEAKSLVERIIDEKYQEVSSQVKQDSSLVYLDKINAKLEQFKKDFALRPVLLEIEALRDTLVQMQDSVTGQFAATESNTELTRKQLTDLIENSKNDLTTMTGKEVAALLKKINSLDEQLSFQSNTSSTQGKTLKSIIADFNTKIDKVTSEVRASYKEQDKIGSAIEDITATNQKRDKENKDSIEKLRREILSRLSNIGGGNQNRNIAIGGNTSVLSKYTDINLKAGSNVTITYTNNDTTKYTDITIAATGGGGGSVGGVVRSINTVSTSQTMGSVAGTDYVYLASAGIRLALPPAAGNTNLYTIKNVSNSSVLVAGTIDDDAGGVIMPIKYTSVDIVSNDTDWKIT